ncbi:MAG: hypothetical protein ACOX4B_03695 [Bacillota bacterium]
MYFPFRGTIGGRKLLCRSGRKKRSFFTGSDVQDVDAVFVLFVEIVDGVTGPWERPLATNNPVICGEVALHKPQRLSVEVALPQGL